ncbi:H-type small acid-soluble spore protein [Alkalihalobacterium chitinilyticum]|uniref:Small, acid-soluble spore protein H n=1 Tax=Alkalihalobacterium chitinilyticum TaxID=2980103 RepID=A0ABT5VD15_9BACI|nr:H-type small acid-soluble spore protein [Alkalihalobacterium chitinilyticum]MDE5413330.1 H-type small acid-soluble spore protein [Alkalihalobacterium chitinilyticum]
MDAQRAQEISSSQNMKTVTYNGQQVYIEHVDQNNEMATIHPMDDPNQKMSVSVRNLSEQ